jgi:hypothetical protein
LAGLHFLAADTKLRVPGKLLSHRTFSCAANNLRYLDLNDVVLNSVDNQIADGVQAQFPHYVAAMRFHGLSAQVQEHCHFLGAFPFREKLRNFTFSSS